MKYAYQELPQPTKTAGRQMGKYAANGQCSKWVNTQPKSREEMRAGESI
jgi:hypothetical protein